MSIYARTLTEAILIAADATAIVPQRLVIVAVN
jgi:hypothetical protein